MASVALGRIDMTFFSSFLFILDFLFFCHNSNDGCFHHDSAMKKSLIWRKILAMLIKQ